MELKNSNSLNFLTIKDKKKQILEQLEKIEQLNKEEEVFQNKLIEIKNIDNNNNNNNNKEEIIKNEKKTIKKKNEITNIIKINEFFEKKLKKSNSSKIILKKFLDESTQTYPHEFIFNNSP